ncbi:hypothetical protein [Halalkalibacterium halodurans]|uniref:hypothetical protein n=1 Tax=Halalkalibacterium halodurans TaxID=86665 RepID=UPI002AAA1E4B|nr:hypothetical protein [Halalkalibacterium halodurans]MDY7223747.1 hypothetical protein [Halalkalibacterium halodurans]MDY7242968.1 hypothetical protein [Halalkalibacterium halodurans]
MSRSKVKPPEVSPETMKAIKQFLLKTCIPRILEAERKQKEQAAECATSETEARRVGRKNVPSYPTRRRSRLAEF